MLCDRLATNLRPGLDRLELPVRLGKSLHEIKLSRVTCHRFTNVPNDLRGHRVNYDQPAKTCDHGGSSWELGHSQVKMTSSRTVLTVKSGRGACRFQWRVGPSYYEYRRKIRPWPSLVLIMACRLIAAKPLSELMLENYGLREDMTAFNCDSVLLKYKMITLDSHKNIIIGIV